MLKKIILLICIFYLSCLCYADKQEISKVDSILLKVEQTTKNIKDIQFDYIQNVNYSLVDESQKYSGVIKYKDKNHICMFQNEPQKYYTYVNDNKITNYIPENKQAIVENWKNVLNNDVVIMTILDFQKDLKNFKKNNTIEFKSETNVAYTLQIVPKKTKSNLKMNIELNKGTMLINKIVYSNNNYTIVVTLTNYKINNGFSKNIFKFVAPEDVEVIEF